MSNEGVAINKNNKLGSEKVSKLIMSFFATSLVGLVLNSVYNLTDTLFISWGVGDMAMSGVAVIAPFVLLQGAVSTMIGGGASTLVSLKLGDGKLQEAGNITINAMVIFYSIAIATTVLGLIFMRPLLTVMGASAEIMPYAKDYFGIILIGNVLSTGFSSIMRAEGKNLYSMFTWVTTIVINIILDAVFILVFKWGVRGAAAATVIGQAVGVGISIFYFARASTLKYKGARVQWKTIGSILKIGLPSLVQMGSLSVVLALLNALISKHSGATSLITFGYMSKLLLYAIAPLMAISQAMSPIIGYNFGNGSAKRVGEGVKISMIIAMVYAGAVFVIFEAMPRYLMMMFTNNPDIITQGTEGLRIVAVVLLMLPITTLVGAKLQAIGSKWWAMLINGSVVIFAILPSILMGRYLGMNGLMWAYVIANSCACVLAVIKVVLDKCKNHSRQKD